MNGSLSLLFTCQEDEAFQSDDAVDNIITKVMQNDQRLHDVTLTKRNSQAQCNPNLKFPESSNVQIIDSKFACKLTLLLAPHGKVRGRGGGRGGGAP